MKVIHDLLVCISLFLYFSLVYQNGLLAESSRHNSGFETENAVVQFVHRTYYRLQVLWLVKTKTPLVCANQGLACVLLCPAS
jgi:hypothetical protein